MSGFSAMNTGVRGLAAAQRAMDVISQNIVNANTPGYSRQRVALASEGSTTSATFFSGNQTIFGGVRVDGVTRIRDAFLEAAAVSASNTFQMLDARKSTLDGIEGMLGEPSDQGLASTLNDFFSSWSDVAQRPQDGALGAVVVQRGNAVGEQLKVLGSGLSARWTVARDELSNVVTQVNQMTSNLASLNARIRERSGEEQTPNDLLDQRDMLIRNIGDLIGATPVTGPDGSVGITLNGVQLVHDAFATPIQLEGAVSLLDVGTDPLRLTWGGGNELRPAGGQGSGLLQTLTSDMPELLNQLNTIATTLRDGVNQLHSAGFTLNGTAGGDFFAGTDALSIMVAISDSSELALSSVSGTVDGSNARVIGELADDALARNALGGPGPIEQWRSLVTGLGVTTQALQRATDVQQTVLTSAENAVEADSGVNLDEEMSNMLLYQRAYQASARVITAADELLETLISRTGLVGR